MNESQRTIASVTAEEAWTLFAEACRDAEALTLDVIAEGHRSARAKRIAAELNRRGADAYAWGRVAVARTLGR